MAESDQERFLTEILANPADRDVRLVFADWLEEQGNARGELIRLQIQLEKMKASDRGYATLRKKERALFNEYPPYGDRPGISGWEYRAGFVEKIEMTLTAFLRNATEVFEHSPVQHVTLKAKSKKLDRIAQMPELSRLRSIELRSNELGNAGLRTLLSSPHLTNLESLTIYSNGISNEGVTFLSQLPNLKSLTELKIAWNEIDDKATAAIVDSQTLGEITSLRLDGDFTDQTLRLIAGSPRFRNLKKLTLNGDYSNELRAPAISGFSERGLEALSTGVFDTPIEELAFQRNLRRGFAKAFENSARLSSVKRLILGWCAIEDDDIVLMARYLRNVEEMHLEGNRISTRGANALSESPLLENLQKLYLTDNSITAAGVHALVDSPYRQKATKFYLRTNRLAAHEVEAVREKAGKSFGNFGKLDPWGRWR